VSRGAKVWYALWTVYIIWGSTYLGIELTVETIPPIFAVAVRFVIAGSLIAAIVDCFVSPVRSVVVSWLFVAFLSVELWWWPKEQARLVANAERAAKLLAP
jgi:hypothetical protein